MSDRNIAAEGAMREIVRLQERVTTLEATCAKQNYEIEQILGRALGYPRYADDQRNFPGATGDDVCVGDHVAETLAEEAAKKLMQLERERDHLHNLLADECGITERWREATGHPDPTTYKARHGKLD